MLWKSTGSAPRKDEALLSVNRKCQPAGGSLQYCNEENPFRDGLLVKKAMRNENGLAK